MSSWIADLIQSPNFGADGTLLSSDEEEDYKIIPEIINSELEIIPQRSELRRTNSGGRSGSSELYKLLCSILWVQSGGMKKSELQPYTDEILALILTYTPQHREYLENVTKYLFSNSRRNLSEFIVEVILAVLAGGATEAIALQEVLIEISKLPSLSYADSKIKGDLAAIATSLFSEPSSALEYFFTKRFTPQFVEIFDVAKFINEDLFKLVTRKFIITALLLGKEGKFLSQESELISLYANLIDFSLESDEIMDLMLNNRRSKISFVRKLIPKYDINGPNSWNMLKIEPYPNIWNREPFSSIKSNPLLPVYLETSVQKRKYKKTVRVTDEFIDKLWLDMM